MSRSVRGGEVCDNRGLENMSQGRVLKMIKIKKRDNIKIGGIRW